ncbi:hypothetical protein, partial [Pseudomonas aeruginosa]|uniref:hypothetical protein n=1 Tax=Pseudomonas aeruginosa TaxID=287 RepID=UPI00397B9931
LQNAIKQPLLIIFYTKGNVGAKEQMGNKIDIIESKVKVREGMEAMKGKGVGGKHREFSLVSCSVSPVTLRKCKPSSL